MNSVLHWQHLNLFIALYPESNSRKQLGTSIPRHELCAALAASQSVHCLISELDNSISSVINYSDSLVVFGYLRKKTKKFSLYVTAPVGGIRLLLQSINGSISKQTKTSRHCYSRQLLAISWLSGSFLLALFDDLDC